MTLKLTVVRGEIEKIASVQNRYEDALTRNIITGEYDEDDYDDYYNRRRRNGGFLDNLFDFD